MKIAVLGGGNGSFAAAGDFALQGHDVRLWRRDAGTVAAHREEFEFDRHCSGANLDATPHDIIRRIERYSGVKLTEAFAIPDLDREIKWHCRYARQNGIHVSPTFMVDGLVRADMSSGDPVADWLSRVLKD